MFSLAQTITQYSHTCILWLTYSVSGTLKILCARFLPVELARGRPFCFDGSCLTLSQGCVTQVSSQHWKKGHFLHIPLPCPLFPRKPSDPEKELSAFDGVSAVTQHLFKQVFVDAIWGFSSTNCLFHSIFGTTDSFPPPTAHTCFVSLWYKFFYICL